MDSDKIRNLFDDGNGSFNFASINQNVLEKLQDIAKQQKLEKNKMKISDLWIGAIVGHKKHGIGIVSELTSDEKLPVNVNFKNDFLEWCDLEELTLEKEK